MLTDNLNDEYNRDIGDVVEVPRNWKTFSRSSSMSLLKAAKLSRRPLESGIFSKVVRL